MPNRLIDAGFTSFLADGNEQKLGAKRQAVAWANKATGFLILFGPPGTGKGHLATSCLKQLGAGLFITHADMLVDLRASYGAGNTKDLLERWETAKLLVVDEFGLRSEGKDEAPMLYQILAKRHDDELPTVLTTNLEMPAVRELLGPRLMDRIREDCVTVAMFWDSYRTGK